MTPDDARAASPMTDRALDLVTTAARRAAAGGDGVLDAGHLLWAATHEMTSRRLLARAGADPDDIARAIEPTLGTGPPIRGMPDPTGDATRALVDAERIRRRQGSRHISPEQLLLALAGDTRTDAGRVLSRAQVTPESLVRAAAHHPMP